MKHHVLAGTTDYSVLVKIRDTAGAPATGLAETDVDIAYARVETDNDVTTADVTPAALTALTDAHSDWGFEEVSATDHPGLYRLDIADAVFASGAWSAVVTVTGTGLDPADLEFVLVAYNQFDGVRLGLTALPNAAADAAGGLPISDAGGLDLDAQNTNVSAILADTGTDGVVVSTSTQQSIADTVWDEPSSGHVAAGSFGAALAQSRSGTAQAGAATTITLDASASAVDDFYNNARLFIVAGTGVGQGRFVTDYDGTTKIATVDTWATNPDNTSVFVVLPFGPIPGATAPSAADVADAVWDEALSGHTTSGSAGEALGGTILRTGTAQAGAASTITLDASASATNDLYNYNIIRIIGGTGAGQSRQISDYVGASKVATVALAWTTQPSSDSVFQIIALGVDAATVAAIADGVWDEARSGHVTAGSFGEYVLADAVRISGDATAANNAESFFDGTGYAGTNNVIPTVTAVTNTVTANMAQISGDSTAADNLEAALDGTGGVTITAAVTGDITGNLSGSVGSVTGAVGSVSGAVASVTAAVTVGTNNDKTGYALSSAGIDAILDEPITEPAGVFAWASATLRNIVGYLGAKASNRQTETATTYTLRNRANSASIATATNSDDGTTTVKGSDT